jgi:hypothetical protein
MEIINGTIIGINPETIFVAADTVYGITVFECEDFEELELQDEIKGTLDDHGDGFIIKQGTSNKIPIYVQGIHCSKENALKLLSGR